MVQQLYRAGAAGIDYLNTWDEWLVLQTGVPPFRAWTPDPQPKYVDDAIPVEVIGCRCHPQGFIDDALHVGHVGYENCPESIAKTLIWGLVLVERYLKKLSHWGQPDRQAQGHAEEWAKAANNFQRCLKLAIAKCGCLGGSGVPQCCLSTSLKDLRRHRILTCALAFLAD
jgi:hypothetical protein